MGHQLLEDLPTGIERLGRRLGGLQLGTLRREGATSRCDLRGLARSQIGLAAAARSVVTPRPAVPITAEATPVALSGWSATGPAFCRGLARPLIHAGALFATEPTAVISPKAAATIVTAESTPVATSAVAVPVPVALAKAGPFLAGRRRGERLRGRGVALGCGTTQLGPWRGHDPGRLGAHAEDPSAARREDLEIEVVEADAECLAGISQRLLDGLS
jgi:hypothetical protein